MDRAEFSQIIKQQDQAISDTGVDVWVGMEPTFTRRFSESPEWLSEALGTEKLDYACKLTREIIKRQPGGIVLRTLGRQYAGEEFPRWSLGYYQARNNQFTWNGPPDPLLLEEAEDTLPTKPANIETFWQLLNDELGRQSWQSVAFTLETGLGFRILLRCDGSEPVIDFDNKPLLRRDSVHESAIPLKGLTDELAKKGDLLLCLGSVEADDNHRFGTTVVIELPEMPGVDLFIKLLQCIEQAAKQCGVETLICQGFPPPADASVAWTTITPDPAVIEINQAPSNNTSGFFAQCELCYQAAQAVGLDPYRLHYNGAVSDSGGGGQVTLGGYDPLHSPFFRYPHLLPRLIRYFNAHPALSYWFAPPSVGSSSQSPRADENVRASFLELSLGLEQLEKTEQPEPEFIWRSLSHFLVDPSGNAHRSELNIEKLWNPWLPGRGCLGLVEFRAFRMARSPHSATAIAVLLRSIVAMLSRENKVSQLLDHGASLHDKYALPLFLQQDLEHVFKDLQDAGSGLHDYLKTMLLQEPVRFIGKAGFNGCSIELHQALEFWPLVGDFNAQGDGGSRLMDASTTRLQITIDVPDNHDLQPDQWALFTDDYRIPLHRVPGTDRIVYVMGIRYRNFMPFAGMHPGIPSRTSVTLMLAHRELDEALQIAYFEWHPQNKPYPGLPEDMQEAESRRQQRFTTSVVPFREFDQHINPPAAAITEYCLDLRRLPEN